MPPRVSASHSSPPAKRSRCPIMADYFTARSASGTVAAGPLEIATVCLMPSTAVRAKIGHVAAIAKGFRSVADLASALFPSQQSHHGRRQFVEAFDDKPPFVALRHIHKRPPSSNFRVIWGELLEGPHSIIAAWRFVNPSIVPRLDSRSFRRFHCAFRRLRPFSQKRPNDDEA